MSERSACHGLMLMFKISTGRAPNYLSDLVTFTKEIHQVNTRSSRMNAIWIGKDINAKSHRNSFIFSMSVLFNKLPENIINSVSAAMFKTRLKKHITENKLKLPDHFL